MNVTPSLRHALAAASVAALSLLAGTAVAGAPSSFAESRGYQNCQDAVGQDVDVVALDSAYYIYERDTSRTLYLNGHARLDGTSKPIRIACETTRSGNRVLAVNVERGTYEGRIIDSATVAAK